MSSCFQFRDTPKKVEKSFKKAGYKVVTNSILIGEKTLHFVQTGNSDTSNPLVIFVHGSPGASNNFNDNLWDSILQANFEMISVDRPGFGYSNFGHSMPRLVDQSAFLGTLLDSFIGRKIILVGHSYGGPIIVRMAIDFPNKIHGLCLVAASVDPDLEPEESWRKPLNSSIGRFFIPKVMEVSNEEIIPLKQDLIDMEPHWVKVHQAVYVLQGQKDKLVLPGNADFAQNHLINVSWLRVERLAESNHFIPFKEHNLITKALMALKGQVAD